MPDWPTHGPTHAVLSTQTYRVSPFQHRGAASVYFWRMMMWLDSRWTWVDSSYKPTPTMLLLRLWELSKLPRFISHHFTSYYTAKLQNFLAGESAKKTAIKRRLKITHRISDAFEAFWNIRSNSLFVVKVKVATRSDGQTLICYIS